MEQPFVYAIAFDPQEASTVYAAASLSPNLSHPEGLDPGIYRSVDGGMSWARIDVYMPHYQLRALAIDPLDSNQLYVGTLGQGVLHGIIESGETQSMSEGGLAVEFRGVDSEGGIVVGIVGPDGIRVTLEVSEDLKEWTELDTFLLNNGEAEYLDESAADTDLGFYRAVAAEAGE